MKLLASVSLALVTGCVGVSAYAAEYQENTTGNGADKASEAAPQSIVEGDGTAVKKNKDSDDTTVVVRGYRASLRSAREIKRRSSAIVDAVVAEDIGKLPDNNAAESLARIPGVQLSRSGDEGNGVLVRGLPDVATTVNGRDISTAELRRVQMQDFPSGALAGLEVYKSGTADLLEPGLAGLVNVRTRKPFDFKGFELDGAFRVTYNDQNGKYDPNANVLISNRWNTNVGEIGALLNLSYSEQNYRNAVRWADGAVSQAYEGQVTDGSADAGFYIPNGVGVYNDSGLRYRPSANAALQWKVSDNLELYAEGLWQAYRASGAADWNEMYLNGVTQLSNVVLDPEMPNQAMTLTASGGYGDFYRSTFKGRTDTSQIAFGAIYNNNRLKLSTDLAYTNSVYFAQSWSIDSELATSPTLDVNLKANGGGAAFNVTNIDVSDPSNYIWRGYYESIYKTSGNNIQWRGDVDYQTDWGIIKSIQAGIRYTDRHATLRNGNRYAWTLPLRLAFADTPFGELSLTQDTFRSDTQGFTQWLEPSVDGVLGNTAALRAYTVDSLKQIVAMYPNDAVWAASLATWEAPLDYNPLWGFSARESTRTGYLQAKYETKIFGIEADGAIGVRAVNTIGNYSGTSSVIWDGVTESIPKTIHQNYLDLLPNISIRFRPRDDMQVRFAVTKTRTRPDFSSLNPALTITQNTKTGDATNDAIDAVGSVGNPDLKPLTSTNYDATFEYYFSKSGSFGVSLFYKDLFGFISTYTRTYEDPTYGNIKVSRPENAGEGKIQGVEVGGQTFFDFLPGAWSGLGIQANATYLDGKERLPAENGTFGDFALIPGVSTWSYNLALFYERGKISTRLSLNGRSGWYNSYYQALDGAGFTGEGTEKVERLDYSFNYTLNENLTVNFDASNLLAVPYHNFSYYLPGNQFPRDIRDEGRYYGFSLRYKFN